MGFDWNGHDGDMYMSLSGIVKNGGYFKSEKQAEYFRPRNPERPMRGEDVDMFGQGSVGRYDNTARADAKFMQSSFGIPLIKKDQYVLILSGTLRFGGGSGHGFRGKGWAFVMDCQGVVKEYVLGYSENVNKFGAIGIGVDGSKTKLEFTRKKIPGKELDVSPYDPLFKEMKKQFTQRKNEMEQKNVNSQYFGEVGKREIFALKLVNHHESEGHYGTSYIYFFEDPNENKAVWFSSRDVGLKKGQVYAIKGTVKSHDMYQGIKQTYLTRCKVQ